MNCKHPLLLPVFFSVVYQLAILEITAQSANRAAQWRNGLRTTHRRWHIFSRGTAKERRDSFRRSSELDRDNDVEDGFVYYNYNNNNNNNKKNGFGCNRFGDYLPNHSSNHRNDRIVFPTDEESNYFGQIKRKKLQTFRKTLPSKHCGLRSSGFIRGRIIGGRPAEKDEFPWQVAIGMVDEGSFQVRGGGTIIDRHWVVTAAHIFLGETDIDKYTGLIGTRDLNITAKRITFDRMIQHPNFPNEAGRFENDIALLHIKEHIRLYPEVNDVNTLCLPASSDQFKGVVTVSGWGIVDNELSEAMTLMTVNIKILPDKLCKRNFRQFFDRRIMICAGNRRGGKDSCRGDSGGPLMKFRAARAYLIGIVSFGAHSTCARKGHGAVYTKITSYTDWIRSNIT